MWDEAEAKREEYGCTCILYSTHRCCFEQPAADETYQLPMTVIDLGKTHPLLSTENETGNTIITISYWKSIEHLHTFARGPAHRAGWDWANKALKGHPYLGIMHELYSAPKGHWENIYANFKLFGMGK